MPYTEKQKRLFQAAAHNPDIAQKHQMTKRQARRLAHEGMKHSVKKQGY